MTSRTKFPPDPSQTPNLFEWARRITSYLRDTDGAKSVVIPQAILLLHRIAGSLGLERATEDGLLMFNPATKNVEVTIGGSWVPLVSQAATLTGSASLASGGSTVNFGQSFVTPPRVILSLTTLPPSGSIDTVYITSVTTAGFTAQARRWDGSTVSDIASNVNWQAQGDPA